MFQSFQPFDRFAPFKPFNHSAGSRSYETQGSFKFSMVQTLQIATVQRFNRSTVQGKKPRLELHI
jgi:hypothetical protein